MSGEQSSLFDFEPDHDLLELSERVTKIQEKAKEAIQDGYEH